ncbi:MAG: hypothetical protein M1828_000479 [Chrysothrix sp. TS-e1954]|nr:MAG: hypothetical protein M1828_000479 [Chrysothrix sp. TS-e1954]
MSLASSSFRLRPHRINTFYPSLSHVRGKKKTSKAPLSISVKLRKDFPGYGRTGTIVPVPFGSMRNYFYPEGIADYIPAPVIRRLKRDNTLVERDRLFGMAKVESNMPELESSPAEPEAVRKIKERIPKLDLNVLPPDRAFKLLDETLPPTIEFHRRPIEPLETRRRRDSQDSDVREAQTIAPSSEVSPRQVADNIYGSVTISDITNSIRALLDAKQLSGLLINLPDEDISFVELGETNERADKIKKLGDYTYEIKIKGQDEVLRRSVRVLAEDPDEPVNVEAPPGGHSVSMDGGASDSKRMSSP